MCLIIEGGQADGRAPGTVHLHQMYRGQMAAVLLLGQVLLPGQVKPATVGQPASMEAEGLITC